MKTIEKISIIILALLAFNSSFAQHDEELWALNEMNDFDIHQTASTPLMAGVSSEDMEVIEIESGLDIWDEEFSTDVESAELQTEYRALRLDAEIDVYPNPMIEDVKLRFDLMDEQRTSLYMYNLEGGLVRTLFVDELRDSGHHEVWINLERVGPGQYFFVLQTPQQSVALQVTKI